MPIFDNELLGNQSNREYSGPDVDISSSGEAFKEIDSTIGLDIPGQFSEPFQGITADQARNFRGGFMPMNVNSPFSVVSKSELLENQRYPLYERGINLENVYGLQQSGLEQLGNGLVKMGAFALGTFGQSFATIPNTARAIKNGSLAELSNPDGYEASIDDWMKNVENYFPNYVTDYERKRGLATAIPFTYGSANFWGDKILKNSGFMVGAIAGSITQDAIIGAATEGVGVIPLVAVQLGKASLYLNKLFAGANKVDRVLDLARTAGKTEKTLMNIERLGQLAAATKLTNGFRYGMSIYGSARTEAAIESRESYRTIKEQLTEQYKLDNFGEEPSPEAIGQIEEYATDAMNTRFGINMALLTVSNAVQFGNIFKSFTGAQKGVTSSALNEFGAAGKVGLKEGTLDTFERKIPETFSGKAWEYVKPKAINLFTEGVYEEGGQFSTQVGVEDYYTRKYKAQGKESWDFVKEAMTSTTKGMAEQFGSSAGIESMVVGAITAAITGPISGKITGESKKNNQRLESTLNILNQYGMTGILSNKYEDTSKSVEISKQMNDAVKSGNIFNFKNLKADMFFGFVNSKIPLGMHDVTIEQLEMLKDLPKEEFEKTFGMDFSNSNKDTVGQYVDGLINKANNINDISTSINFTFNNPYNRIIDPKTDDEKTESLKYQMFENWKTDLSHFSYVQQDSTERLLEIQTSLSKINPLLTNNLLALASSEKGLKELSDTYQQKANQLNESLSNLTPAQRVEQRSEIKKLRTLSEKINIALSSDNIDPKLFNDLINFEISNQDFSQLSILRIDETSPLKDYAEDLHKIAARKEQAAIKFEDLSSEKGFDKYFKEAEDIANSEISLEDLAIGLAEPTFVNKDKQTERLQVGREYAVDITKKATAPVKISDNSYRVTAPDGTISYHKTRKEAVEESNALTEENKNLSKVKILSLNDDGTVKVEDLNGDIFNINPKRLKGYIKLQTQEEKLAKDKETLDKDLEKLTPTGSTIETTPVVAGKYIGSDDKRKDVDRLFLSGTSVSEDSGGEEANNRPHIKRARTFLNNFKFFKNKDKIKLILVTPNNAKELGLEGIIQLNYAKPISDSLTEGETNVNLGFMAQVFIIQTPKGNFFVNEKGEELSEVGVVSATILDNVVFQTMTSASLKTVGGSEKVRKGQEEEAEKALEAYKIFRQDVFAQKGYTPYSFAISRGIPRQNKVNEQYEDNYIADILGPDSESIIAKHDGLIEVVTTGKVEHDGELLSFPIGTPLVKYGDLLDYANNKNVTNKQANNIVGVIDALAKDLFSKMGTPKAGKLDYNYFKFLNSVLYFKFDGNTKTPSQIGIDTTNMEFKIGNKSFPLSKIQENKKEIINALQEAFISVNNKTLNEGTSKKFTEYVVDKTGQLKPVVWKNYQSYLLSSKNPDGSSRSVEETPLITHTVKATDNVIPYKQKYAYVTDKDVLPYDRVPVKESKPAPDTVTEEDVIGEYKLDNKKVNTSNIINAGPVSFTGKIIKANGKSIVEVEILDNDTIEKLTTDQTLINAIDANLASFAKNPDTESLIPDNIKEALGKDLLLNEKAKLFVNIRVSREIADLENAPKQAAPKPAPVQKDRKTEIKEKLKSIQGRSLGFSSSTTPGTSKFTENGTKVTFVKSQRDKYGRGNEEFTITTPNGITSSVVVDYKQRPSNGFSDNKELPFDAEYSENPKALLDELTALEKASIAPISDIENKIKKLFEFTERGQIILAGEDYDLIKAVRNNPTDENIRKFLELYKSEVGKYEQSIIDEVDAELDALEGGEEKTSVKKPFNSGFKFGGKPKGPSEYRMVGKDSLERMTNVELEIFKQWHADNVPFIPFEILENIIKRGDVKAWGVFENGVAKFVRGGLRGTEYHEIFEAIYADFLTETEKNNLLTEFRNKKGEFTDRQSGKKIVYSDATDKEAKERIADDFSDFRLGKLPARSLGETVRNLFKKIMDFFKSFVSKPSLKDELFKTIDSGKFKETKLSERAKTLAPEYRAIEGLTEEQTNDFIQDVVSQVKLIIFREGKKELLFNPEKLTGKEVFDRVREIYDEAGAIDSLGEDRYNQLIKKSIELLRTIGVSFNTEDVVSINNEDANNREYTSDAFSTDWKQHSSGALKFLLSTLTERKALNQTKVEKGKKLEPAEEKRSTTINGLKLLNFNKVFATLFDRLHNTNSPQEFTEKFIQLAKEDSNYLPLFKALGGNLVTHTFDFENFGIDTDWRLFIQFFNTFTRQKPEALIQYTNKEGEVFIGNANMFTTVNQTIDSWINNMKAIGKAPGGIISFDKKVYKIDRDAIKDLPIKKSNDMIAFLNKLGIEFNQATYDALSDKETIIKGKKTTEVKEFTDAVGKIYTQLGKNNELMTFDAKRLDINGPLRTLSGLYNKVNNPNQDSTYFGVEGQRIGSFSENNAPSYFENTFNETKTLAELLEKRPELNDIYSRGSEILKLGGLFFDEDGNRIAEIKVEYIQGSKNELTEKDKATANLTEGERFMQEINQNINGKYYVLIPGDSSTEWMMNLGNVISMDDVKSGNYWNKVYSIYSNYLNDDINLALANRQQNIYQKAKSQELRIMKDILPQEIVEDIEERIKEGQTYDVIQEYISENREAINKSVKDFLEGTAEQTFNILQNSKQILNLGENEYAFYYNLDSEFAKKYNLQGALSYDEVMNVLNFVNINYAINNQEYHKILFGDPYQFKTAKGKLDETKRVKSFLSPRRRTFDMIEYNNKLKDVYNTVDDIKLEEGTPGYHDYKSYTNTVTFSNVDIVGSVAMMPNVPDEIKEAFANTDETDAMSWLMDNTHKEIALKEGQWSPEAEAFHQWQMAYTRRAFDKKGIKKYESNQLKERDAKLLESPMPKHKLAVRKPIISGTKANKTEIDLVLDKTSQMPFYYNMVEDTNLENMYIQMFKQNIGYSIVASGRKVGAESLHAMYNKDGFFNKSDFNNIIEIPWSIYGTQVETMSEGEKTQTRGSQLTKLASMDLFSDGEAIGDTPERKEEIKQVYERNKKALDMFNENGYNELLNKLGVVDLGDGFALEDKQRISETLMYEMMRRDLSENAKDTIQLDENGEFIMPFEASPSYIQIKNILYSLVNKALTSPAMNGAPHVQAPVTGFESLEEGRGLARKTDKGWIKITKTEYDALSDEDKEDVKLTDDTLKFYEDEDGKRYCEVMLPNWFKSKLKTGKFKNYTDEQLIDYLNKTPDGKKILSGIGFRIPTDAINKAEVFKVKKFLPEYMGYTVIVPSEITTKAGSDFDIDKLNMYLKSIYINKTGDIKLVKYLGSEEATKAFFAKNFDEVNQGKVLRKLEILEAVDTLIYGLEDTKGLLDKYGNFILSIQDQYADPFAFRAEVEKELEKLTDENLKAELKEREVNNMYKRSLENEYYDSLEEILTLPENFNRLINPTNDAGLEKIAELLDKKRGYNETNIKGRLVNRNYMTNLRHAFITGKKWVGIAAVNITSLSLRQKSKVYLNFYKLPLLPKNERKFIKDLSIVLPHNTLNDNGQTYVSLSATKTADGTQFISDRLSGYATAFVDIANNPFISKIIKSDVIVSTFMFLESIGAGNTGIFFLNQPIIEKYIEYLNSINSKSVTGTKNLKYIRSLFPTTDKAMEDANISVEQLLDNIEEYSREGKFDQAKNAEQQLILSEFIKYKILADQLFSYTQATNYDTTKFGSSDSLLKKEWGTFNASNFNLISNVKDVLDKTFIGKQSDLLSKAFNSFGAIMKTELPEIKAYTLSTLKKYATRKYMSMDDYEKIANLIKNAFLDYVIQNNTTMSNMIKPMLVDSETSIVGQLEQAKQKYPSMQILQDLVPVTGNREGSASSIKLKVNTKDAYSENLYVGMMREMRDTPELNDLYNNIVNVAILQGTTQSAISIRNIIPVEDYAAKIAPFIQQLQPSVNLEAFANGMFERNNFTNENLFKEFIPNSYTPQPLESTGEYHPNSVRLNPITGEEELIYSFFAFKEMKGVTKTSRRLLTLNDVYNSFQLDYDFIKIPKVVTNRDGVKINIATGLEITKKDYAIMKEKGSQDLYNNYYYKKVYTNQVDKFNNPIPLRTYNEKIDGYDYYYKLINVYGDSNRATEINTNFTPSVINNGSVTIKEELNDIEIVNQFASQIQEEFSPLLEETTLISEEEEILVSPEDTEAILIKLGAKKVSKGQLNIDGQFWYLNKEYWSTMNKTDRNELFLYPGPGQEIYVGEDTSGNYKFTTDTEFYKKYVERNKPTETVTEPKPSTSVKASIPQNKVSGIESFGSLVTANDKAIEMLGPNPYSIDMIEAGIRTRTTRSESEMDKYAIKVGDTIKHFGKSADDSTKTIYAKVTAIHPKGSEGWKGTWAKEGWRTEDVNVIDRFKDGAAAIEFEVIRPAKDVSKQVSKENLFTTKINQFTYSYNPSTQEVIHNSKTGDKIETNETQIGKVLAEYAKANNLLTQSFNNQDYSKIGDRVVNVNNGSIVTQKQILDLFQEKTEVFPMEEQLNRLSIFDLRNLQIDYTSGQITALEDISNIIDREGDGHYLLAGYAGTGKTTIAENIAKYAKEAGKAVLVIAPTNKAAKVLNDKLKSTGVGSVASTIHKTIYGEPNEFGEWEKSSDIKNSVVIIDESSMIEKSLMEDLLSSTKNKNNVLIFMGDSYQLQPVGEDSGLFQGKVQEVKNNQTELTEVKRQSLDSSILKVATVIRNDKKSYVLKESTEDFIVTRSKNQFVENFKQAIKNNEDVAMIVATNNERILMNKIARNAKFGEEAGEVLNPSETIISIANSTEYSNSEIFNVKDLRGTPQKFDITFTDNFGKSSKYDIYLSFVTNNDNREVPMLFFPNVDKPSIYHAQILKSARETSPDLYDALEGWVMNTKKGPKLSPAITIGTYGYSITAHKSQGSQWDKVFVNQNYVAESWDAARWFYTAITRAAKEVEVLPSASNIQISDTEVNSKLNNIVQEDVITENFDTIKDFTPERKKEILTNFADKHKMSTEQAKEHINKAIAENREEVINKLKDCY